MNIELAEAIAAAAHAFKKSPIEFCSYVGVAGHPVENAIWLWLHGHVETPAAFIDFLKFVTADPEANVGGTEWIKIVHPYMNDMNLRIYPGLGKMNEWGIPISSMELTPSMFSSRKFPQSDASATQKIYRHICKKSNYPNAWVKQGEIVKALQGSFNAEQIKTSIAELYAAGHIMSQVTEGRGRPATAYAAVAGRTVE